VPELPEVETYVRALEPLLYGKTILAAEVRWPRTIAAPEASLFPDLIRGRRFVSFGRRGKYMLFGLDSGETLVVHLRMTGELRIHGADAPRQLRENAEEYGLSSAPPPVDKHTHVIFELDSAETLRFRDMRKFGRIWLVEDAQSVVGKLGPEPLEDDFAPRALAQRLAGRKANIKGLLLNQTVVAGVGNIYADESLFRAQIDPRRAGGALDDEEIIRLHQALREVLQAGIDAQGSSLRNYAPPTGGKGGFQEQFLVFRRTGAPCFRCNVPISRIVLGQRSTHFCPSCQK
jgi:formamidopyrimidine-DNA glycosylase